VGQKAQPHDTSKQPQPEPQPPSPGTKTYSQKPSTAASNHQPTQPAAAVNAARPRAPAASESLGLAWPWLKGHTSVKTPNTLEELLKNLLSSQKIMPCYKIKPWQRDFKV